MLQVAVSWKSVWKSASTLRVLGWNTDDVHGSWKSMGTCRKSEVGPDFQSELWRAGRNLQVPRLVRASLGRLPLHLFFLV